MPGLDGTGPMGMGPMTGGGRGLCNPLWAGYRGAGNPWLRYRGYSPWPGYGYSPYPWRMAPAWQSGSVQPGQWGSWYGSMGPGYGPPPEQELEFLRGQAEMLEQELEQISKRIAEIEKGTKAKKR